jgi:prepilin-type N-terminal cleavage/methylation domain-containing protein
MIAIRHESRGFTLVELAVVLVVMGMLLAMSVPAYKSLTQSYTLKGGAENLAAQLRLTREKAISTGRDLYFGCNPGYQGTDYHVHDGSSLVGWKLPKGISFAGATPHIWFYRDGRVDISAIIPLRNQRDDRDTVNVLLSGMATSY